MRSYSEDKIEMPISSLKVKRRFVRHCMHAYTICVKSKILKDINFTAFEAFTIMLQITQLQAYHNVAVVYCILYLHLIVQMRKRKANFMANTRYNWKNSALCFLCGEYC